MNKIIIVGHKNPDTDSIISAIAAQELFSKQGREAEARRAGEINNETKFILQSCGVEAPEIVGSLDENDSVALVDHNEASQVFDDLDYNKVDYILDHHKLAINTEKAIYCRIEPIGSTSSLIAKMFVEKALDIPETIAKMLIAGILSDTLNLTSPTTTSEDRDLIMKLNEIAKIDIEAFVDEMFKAKSSLEGIATEDIITLDYKNFEMGKNEVGVGTWETTNPESVNEKKEEIMRALIVKKESEKLDYMLFMVVDILKQNCQMYIIGEAEKELAEKVFGGKSENNILFLDGVVSRKKQVIPPLTEELSK